jgi:hypothetical protein
MTMPRRQLVDVAVTRYYHCISRCVRRAFLCGEGVTHRKAWIEARLEVLAKHFAISVCGFAILDNHLHVLCRLDPGIADGWSDEDVVRRWIAVYRPSCLDVDSQATVQAWIDQQRQDTARVARYPARLQDIGWFTKALKQRVDQLRANGNLETLQAAAAAKSIPAARIEADPEQSHWLGTYCATSAKQLTAIAAKHGVHHVDNALGGLAAE